MLSSLALVIVLTLLRAGACSSMSLHLTFISSRSQGRLDNTGITSAVQLAIEQVNSSPDLDLRGYTLNLTEISSMCDHKKAQSAFHKTFLADPNQLAVIGAGCSESSVGVAEVARYYNIPLISYASTSEELGDREDFPNFFRTSPSDESITDGITGFVATYPEWEEVVIISQDNEQYKRQTSRLVEMLQAIDVTANATLVLPNDLDYFIPASLFPLDQRIFVLNMEPREAQYVICEAIKLELDRYEYVWILQGWYPEEWWLNTDHISCNASSLEDFIVRQGAVAVSYYPLDLNQTIPTDITGISPANLSQFIPNISPTASFAYDAVLAIALGLNDSLSQIDSNVSLQLDGNVCEANTGFGQRMIESLDQVEGFQGVSGFVDLVNGTRVVNNITILQYRACNGATVLKSVGTISIVTDDDIVEFIGNETRELMWLDGVPSDGTPLTEQNYPYLWLTISSYVFASLVILGALVSIVFTCVFRKRKLVRLTSPNLNLVIALGVIIFNSGVYLFTYPPASEGVLEVFCALRSWVVSIGISLCFGTVNAKMWRIYYIFHNPNPSKKKRPLKDWHLFLIVVVFVAFDFILLTLVSIFETARLKPLVVDDVEHAPTVNDKGITVKYVVTLCEAPQRLIWLVVLFGYKAVIQAIGLFLSLRIRNIKIKVLNDSKEIAATLYLSSAILSAVIVISVALSNRLNVYTASYCYGIPLSTSVVLIVVFFSKMVRLYRDPWGEKIFTHAPPSGTFSGSPVAMNNTHGTADYTYEDKEKVHVLERQVKDLQRKLSKHTVLEVDENLTINKTTNGSHGPPSKALFKDPENGTDENIELTSLKNGSYLENDEEHENNQESNLTA